MLSTDDVLKLTKVLKEHFYQKSEIDAKLDRIEGKIDKLTDSVDVFIKWSKVLKKNL